MSPSAYNSAQIQKYLTYIGLPPTLHPDVNPHLKLDLDYLTTLHVHQISTIPYENLSLHYSRDRQVNLDPRHLYDKFIHRGRGGYCLETSIFYNHVLRALGFQVYTAAVRIRLRKDGVPYGNFQGWRHIVNIVTLPDPTDPAEMIKYMVDVGFGGDGATKPLPLLHDRPQYNLGTQYIRLLHDTIPDQIDRSASQKLWIFQYRNGDDKPWNTYYAFPEVEYTELEFETLNFWLVNHPDSFQRHMVLIIKFLRGGQGRDPDQKEKVNGVVVGHENEITGKLMLADGKLKRNLGGKTELAADLKTEKERIDAIKKWFGLILSDDEIAAIKGHHTELLEPQGGVPDAPPR